MSSTVRRLMVSGIGRPPDGSDLKSSKCIVTAWTSPAENETYVTVFATAYVASFPIPEIADVAALQTNGQFVSLTFATMPDMPEVFETVGVHPFAVVKYDGHRLRRWGAE